MTAQSRRPTSEAAQLGTDPSRAALRAGLLYFAVALAAGFALGTLRVVLLAPALGEALAVALELPVMLAISWLACGWMVRRFRVPSRPAPRAAMGALAFALLMLAELAVAVLALGRSPQEHLATYRGAVAWLGLAGQVAFALFPLMQASAWRGRGTRARASASAPPRRRHRPRPRSKR